MSQLVIVVLKSSEMSINDKDVWKLLVLCATVPLYVCLVLECCFESKLIGKDPDVYMNVFRV